MHLVFLVEDASGEMLLKQVLPRLVPEQHTWLTHKYKGIGRIPKGLKQSSDPAKRQLLDQLPRLLQGFGNTPGYDAVVVLVDVDKRDCRAFKQELLEILERCQPKPRHTLFSLAIEEMEAWLLGDQEAIKLAYPLARSMVLDGYVQDSICGTWETLADAIHAGGSEQLKQMGYRATGKAKCEWAENIGAWMDVDVNRSQSFTEFRDGVRGLIQNVAS
jgi:hypothetical protein